MSASTIDDRVRQWFAAHPNEAARAAHLVQAGVHPYASSVLSRLYVLVKAGELKLVAPATFALSGASVDVPCVDHAARLRRILELADDGMSYEEIGSAVGLGACRIGQLLRKAGRVRGSGRRPQSEPKTRSAKRRSTFAKKRYDRRCAILSLAKQEEVRPIDIAAELGCSADVVRRTLRKHGVGGRYYARQDKQAAPAEATTTHRRAALVAEIRAHARSVGATSPALAWQRLRHAGVYKITSPARDVPVLSDALLVRLHVQEIWHEAVQLPARRVGPSPVTQQIWRGEGPLSGE